jgi:hypothetical protein
VSADCRICGELGAMRCDSCRAVEPLLKLPLSKLMLIVDGSYVEPRDDRLRYPALRERIGRDHPGWDETAVDAELRWALVGDVPFSTDPGHGGAGLVLVKASGKILASRSCSFPADNSSDAEFQAVTRAARWTPGIAIYTDSESACRAAEAAGLNVRFLPEGARGEAHALAHQLSVDGRLRHMNREPRA